MPRATHTDHDKPSLLEVVLRVQGDFRSQLAPLRVTPLQAGVILYLLRHSDAKVTEAAAALGVRVPTLSVVIRGLVRKRWVIRRRALHDDRVVCLRLSRQGEVLAGRIKVRIRDVRERSQPNQGGLRPVGIQKPPSTHDAYPPL